MVENKLFHQLPFLPVFAFMLGLWLTSLSIVEICQRIQVNRQVIELNEYELIDRRLDHLFDSK